MLSDFLFQQLKKHLVYEPTGDQEALLRTLAAFITEPADGAVFVLTGYAGTGKTTVVAALVRMLDEMDTDAVLLAPTGRAAKVLSGYAGKSAGTIHRKIYRQKIKDDPASAFVLAANEAYETVFIVDEASMISNDAQGSVFGSGSLLNDLLQYVRSGTACKLIMVGDAAQLPPVRSPYSPALRTEMYPKTVQANLSEVVRQSAGSGILDNATRLRRYIETGCDAMPAFQLQGYSDIERIGSADVAGRLAEAYDTYGERETVVICRSNKRANVYNNGIRNHLFERDDELVRGDRLMVVKNCYRFMENTHIDFIANGDMAELLNVRRYEERYGFRFARAELRFPDYDNTEITAKIMLDTLHEESAALNTDKQRQLYEAIAAHYAHLPHKQDRLKAVREDEYYNALQIRYANAVTCHKAQGGQWKAVFLDYPFRKDLTPTSDDLRWLYTAFTRATQHLYLVNFDAGEA